jgi:hypothetical protein
MKLPESHTLANQCIQYMAANITEIYFITRSMILLYYIKNRPQLKPQAATCCKVLLPSCECNRAHLLAAIAPPDDSQPPPNPIYQSAEPESRLQNTGVRWWMNVIGILCSVHTTKIAFVERAVESC